MHNHRLTNKFSWVPHQDKPKHPAIPTPYRKPELRRPLYFLRYDTESCNRDPLLRDLYFVNFSEEVLDTVTSASGGFQTVGSDEVMSVGGPDYFYKNVQQNEAVLIEQHHMMYDSDYLLQIDILVKSPTKGLMKFSCIGKGKIDEVVLLWDTSETDKYVSFKNL